MIFYRIQNFIVFLIQSLMENQPDLECTCSLLTVNYNVRKSASSENLGYYRPPSPIPSKLNKKAKVSLSRSFSGLNQHEITSHASSSSFTKQPSPNQRQNEYRKCNIYSTVPSQPSILNMKQTPQSRLKKKVFNTSTKSQKFNTDL